ncbi:glycosyl hydrolase [Streptomyces sp. NPDC004134]|uniref:glycosyl hydrolase n=1 Tax=Streptomyces sp. NPDC004134 TaxID=3364691 RepID=UPI0036C6B545
MRVRPFKPILLAFLIVVAGVSVMFATAQESSGGRADSVTAAAGDGGYSVTLRNETDEPVWVGSTVSADGTEPLVGLPKLDPGQSGTVTIPQDTAGHWRGRFFARQGCGTDQATGTFRCAVGDCGPEEDRCTTGEQPTGLAEFNFDTRDDSAPWYNVSYVDAVSVPITITPDGAPPTDGGACAPVGCDVDLLSACPPENLTTDESGKPLVCVNPNRDAKTPYSDALAAKCPTAYSWSKHDAESGNQVVRQCSECGGFTVTFHGDGAPAPGEDPAPDPPPADGDDAPPVEGIPGQHLKGVALNSGPGVAEALADSGATWYHNWTSSSGAVQPPEGVEYVPTIWGPGSVTPAELDSARREGKHLLGFHEPDNPGQAAMTVGQALDLWPQLEQTGLRLGAPGVAGDAAEAGGWLDRFMKGAEERGLRVDFIPVHWYGSDFGPDAAYQLAAYLQRVHDRYQKPVWLTEYALIDFEQGTYPSQEEQKNFITWSRGALEALDFVERYAWSPLTEDTGPTGLYDGTTPNASGDAFRADG